MMMILQLQHFISLASVVTSYSFQKLDSDHRRRAKSTGSGTRVACFGAVRNEDARGQKVRVREP
jgi:hypothetical protein